MTHEEMFGGALWVAPSGECSQPLVRGAFFAAEPVRAHITVCGLGFFELYVNGVRAAEDYFVPAWSDYEDHRFELGGREVTDRFAHRVYCLRYDITPFVKAGPNTAAFALGAGWYEKVGYGTVKLCYRLAVTEKDGTENVFLSGPSLLWAPGPVLSSRMLLGEVHDLRLERPDFALNDFDAGGWQSVKTVPAPVSDFLLQTCPADRVIRSIEPKAVRRYRRHTIYDAGENITGRAVIELRGRRGAKTEAKYTEELGKNGRLDSSSYTYRHNPKRIQRDWYFSDGKRREVHPRFLWHAFRYFSLSNNAVPLRVEVVHADVPVTSAFECSDETLNWYYGAFVRTQLCNMHAGIPSDCPQREGRGYTGDGQLACDAAMLMLGAKEFYRKWLGDIADCQDEATGHIQYTAPYIPSGGGPGGWGCAVVEVPYVFYRHYGEKAVLEEFFPRMLRYFDYLDAHSEDGLVVSDYPGAWCLGDWCTPGDIQIAPPLVNTYFAVKSLLRAAEIAGIIGRDELILPLAERAEARKKAITRCYFDPATGDFDRVIQGANAFAVDIGLGDARTFANLVAKYGRLGMYDTGIFGTDILTRVLFERGEGGLALSLLANQKEVSFHHMMRSGATTLWEYWSGKKSHSHPMFGAAARYLFYDILGIRQTEGSSGFQDIIISPRAAGALDFAKGHIAAQAGRVSVSLKKEGGSLLCSIDIPEGVRAVFEYGGAGRPLRAGGNSFAVELQ